MDEHFDWKAVMKEIIKPCKNDDDSLNKYQRKTQTKHETDFGNDWFR